MSRAAPDDCALPFPNGWVLAIAETDYYRPDLYQGTTPIEPAKTPEEVDVFSECRSGYHAWSDLVETMGIETTTPCLQSNDRPTRLPGRMCADQAERVGRTYGCVPVFTVVDRCYWHANGTNPTPVARKLSFV